MKLYLQNKIVSNFSEVTCDYKIIQGFLHFNFCAHKKNQSLEWLQDNRFSKELPYRNWGLWEQDVFEVFLQPGGTKCPYYEFQVSTLGQGFQLTIYKSRQIYSTPIEKLYDFNAELDHEYFRGTFKFDLRHSFFKGRKIHAGLFACLGSPRHYFAHYDNKDDIIDFHRDNLFIPLEI
jgi:hypothetical protein